MNNSISLRNFSPFDGMKKLFPLYNYPYENCFYNSMLTLSRYFNIDESAIINNMINIYRFDKKPQRSSGDFKLEVINFKSRKKLLAELGINSIIKSPSSDDLKEEIFKSISHGFPISIQIDLYYQQGREFYFNQKHGIHH